MDAITCIFEARLLIPNSYTTIVSLNLNPDSLQGAIPDDLATIHDQGHIATITVPLQKVS